MAQGTVIRLRGAGGVIGAGILSVACGLAAGCGVPGGTAPHSVAVVAKAKANAKAKAKTQRFCVDEISAATAAEQAAINRYWTPLARSALTVVSQGKMAVTVPKKQLTPAQRRALRRAEWAEQKFGPKPKLVCEQVPAGGAPASAPAVPPGPQTSPGT
jgi:hypothetical protein